MLIDQTFPICAPIINRMSIVVRQLPSALERIPQLPKQVRSHPTILQRQARLLPATLHRTMIRLLGYAILFKQTRFVELSTDLGMRSDPAVAKRIGDAPTVGVEVKSAKTYVPYPQVCLPVYAFAVLVGVGAVAWQTEAFVTHGDHVI